MLLLRRGCCAGCRLRRDSLPEGLLQMFFPLLSSSRLFIFFPLPLFTGLPRLPIFPLPARLFFLLSPELLDLGAPLKGTTYCPCAQLVETNANAAHLSDPICIGLVKTGLPFFSRPIQTIAWGDICKHEFANSHMTLKTLLFEKLCPFFDPLPIGLAKAGLQLFSR